MAYTVKQARRLAGYTQQEMADELHIHRTTYIKLEENPESFTVGQAKVISRKTKIPIDDIFFTNNSTESRVVG